MFGLIVGTLCLTGLFATVRRRHGFGFADDYGSPFGHHHGPCHGARHRRHHPHRGHHHAGWGAPWEGHHGMGGHARRRENPLYLIFAELDTTPGQEKAIMLALDALRETKRALREDLIGSRKELARLFAGDGLDQAALAALFSRQEEHLAKSAQLVRDFIAMVHEALTPEQRKKLAQFMVDGSLWYGFGGRHSDGF